MIGEPAEKALSARDSEVERAPITTTASADRTLRPLEGALVGLVLPRCASSSDHDAEVYDLDQVLRELGLATGRRRDALLSSLQLWAASVGATIKHRAGYRAGQLLVPNCAS